LIVDSPRTKLLIIDSINFVGVYECTVQLQQVWIILEAVYFALLLGWGGYLAYQIRNIWLKFDYPNESKSILLSIYNLAFCGVILVPMMTSLDIGREALLFLVSVFVLWPTSFALFSVYIPKVAKFIRHSYHGSGHDHENEHNRSLEKSGRSASMPSLKEHPAERKLLDGDRHHDESGPRTLQIHDTESGTRGATPDQSPFIRVSSRFAELPTRPASPADASPLHGNSEFPDATPDDAANA